MQPRVVLLALADDTQPTVARIAHAFARRYGRRQVVVCQRALGDASLLTSCQVAIVVIGPHWLAALRDAEPRDSSPHQNDRVQDLLVQALRSPTLVVPLLVYGAQTPSAADLPPVLAPLADRHALVVRPARGFARDMRRVVRHVAIQLERRRAQPVVIWGSITLCMSAPFVVDAAATVSNLVVLTPLALAMLGIAVPVIAQARRQRYWMWAGGLTLLTGIVIGVVVLLTRALMLSGGGIWMWRAVLAGTLVAAGAWRWCGMRTLSTRSGGTLRHASRRRGAGQHALQHSAPRCGHRDVLSFVPARRQRRSLRADLSRAGACLPARHCVSRSGCEPGRGGFSDRSRTYAEPLRDCAGDHWPEVARHARQHGPASAGAGG